MYEPRYIITHNLLKYVGKIEASKQVIENAALVPAYEKEFREEALQKDVHHGTHLEGNELSSEQAEQIIVLGETRAEEAAEKAGIVGRDRDVQEVINYRRVMEWIDAQGREKAHGVKLNEDLLKKLHEMVSYRILPEDERGQWREVRVAVKNSRTGEISFQPPPFVEVPYQVEEFFEWLNSDGGKQHHSILRAGIAHYELVRIHPFTDGNGRTARALAMLLLYLEDYDVKRFFSLEEYFDKNASDYYKALQSVGEKEEYDLTFWLEYFAFGLAQELDKIKQQVLKLSKDVQYKGKIGHQVALSDRQIKILEKMQKEGGKAVSSDIEEVLPMVSIDTILRDLKDLINKGLVEKHGKTKGAYYELT